MQQSVLCCTFATMHLQKLLAPEVTPCLTLVQALLIALMFHQGCEGFALGSTFVLAHYSLLKYSLLALAFTMVTPLGIAIGNGVGASYQSES